MKSLKSDLKKARGLGSAKEGTNTWWLERFTSIILVPLSIWFVIIVIASCKADQVELNNIMKSPMNIILMIIFTSVSLYHGLLGLKVIIEDYVHSKGYKLFLIVTSNIIIYATIVTAISALLAYHFTTLN